MTIKPATKNFLSLSLLTLLVSACGGGGSSSSSDSVDTSNTNSGSTDDIVWVKDDFAPKEQFASLCENPRVGDDFDDVQGSTLAEKMWLRSWNDETYLWYQDVEDVDPNPFTSPQSYFLEALRTNEVSPSGNPIDKFHFIEDTEAQVARTSGVEAGYGVQWIALSTSTPREYRVAYTEPNSPAAEAGLLRGAQIVAIDGVDFINGTGEENLAILQEGLFPSDIDQSHIFTIKEFGSEEEKEITLVSEAVTISPVQNVDVLETASGKVGYMQFNTFIKVAHDDLIEAFQRFETEAISDLVLDLRYNGGGLLALASQLGYMIAGSEATAGKTFFQLQYNDKTASDNPIPFYSVGIDYDASVLIETQPLPSVNLERIFVLTTDDTCSASEAIINGLSGIDVEVVQIGGTTCGKPYGFTPEDNCGTTYYTVQFRGINDKGFGDYSDGFSPENTLESVGTTVKGCSVNDDLSKPLGDATEQLLATALTFRETETCPTPTGTGMKFLPSLDASSALLKSDILLQEPNAFFKNNLIQTDLQ
ncbi:MAG: S41 family peptidase [Pseudomonadota bacterium]